MKKSSTVNRIICRMKTAGFIFFLMWPVSGAWGQAAPSVSFLYDADGNMTARYVVTTHAPATRSADPAGTDRDKPKEEEVLSVMLGDQKINVYPNPTSGKITLGITPLDTRQKNTLRLYHVTGKLLQTIQVTSELTFLEIKGPAGIYLLDIHLGDHVSKWKIIKE